MREEVEGTPGPSEGSDRRKSPRTPAAIPVDYSTVDAFFSEFTTNINEGGMFVSSERMHPIDTLVTLLFKLPSCEEPCQVEGRVVWHRMESDSEGPPGMGIEFEEMDELTRQRINELVRELRTQA